MTSTTIPFLKWPGGKRWAVGSIEALLPSDYNNYIEPFLGGGALFFSLQPQNAILSDVNHELINCYQQIRENWRAIQELLFEYHRNHSETFYYKIRSQLNTDPIGRAARFIYLNRTCWNGLYRVNKKGVFNVPIGTKTNVVLPSDNFSEMSDLLKGVRLYSSDFQALVDQAGSDDLVYLDPPYTVKHNFNGFVKYNEQLFSWNDQVRLRDAARRAAERGAKVMISNADHPSINELYEDFPTRLSLSRKSVLASQARYRAEVNELIICSWCKNG